MNTYYIKILLFTFLINTLVLPHNENFVNNHYNVSLIKNNTQRTTIKLRLLAQTQNHNQHYHNDPELKEIIDKLNDEAIKKYQQTHDPYEQLKEVVEKNGTKHVGAHGTEHMSRTEKELLETYEEVFGEGNHIMLISGMYPNDDDKSDNSSTCECTDINNEKLAKRKGRDKYLENLKERCKGGIGFCSVGSVLLTLIGLITAKFAAGAVVLSTYEEASSTCLSVLTTTNIFNCSTLKSALGATTACAAGAPDVAGTIAPLAMNSLYPWGIAALVVLILAVVLIILYIWLYRRRKNSWKHECKKHLCK
ncbi:stevor PIR protein, putative [Plasmodium sp. DRC-Itaito]|nr:stevor PIR protein, putative [Plasmodium sp. DRC-Itaito]